MESSKWNEAVNNLMKSIAPSLASLAVIVDCFRRSGPEPLNTWILPSYLSCFIQSLCVLVRLDRNWNVNVPTLDVTHLHPSASIVISDKVFNIVDHKSSASKLERVDDEELDQVGKRYTPDFY